MASSCLQPAPTNALQLAGRVCTTSSIHGGPDWNRIVCQSPYIMALRRAKQYMRLGNWVEFRDFQHIPSPRRMDSDHSGRCSYTALPHSLFPKFVYPRCYELVSNCYFRFRSLEEAPEAVSHMGNSCKSGTPGHCV